MLGHYRGGTGGSLLPSRVGGEKEVLEEQLRGRGKAGQGREGTEEAWGTAPHCWNKVLGGGVPAGAGA